MQLSQLFHIRYKRFVFTVNDCFLSADGEQDADINYFIQSPVNVGNALHEFYTLLIDLTQDREAIWKGIYHRTRSEISSFEKHQAFEHRLLTKLSEPQLQEFIDAFNAFAAFKKIRAAEDFRLKAYNEKGILAVSYIRQDENYLCVNFYRLTKARATNLYSFTLKHVPGHSYARSRYGRAHRTLHWRDILAFQEAGVTYYDFCGWYNGRADQALLNINRFKEQFTTYKVKEFSGVIYRHPVLRFLKKWR